MTEAAPISLPTSARHRTRPGGVATRWLVIAAIVVFDLIGFRVADIEVNWSSAEGSFELALLFLVYALVLEQVRQRAERFARVQRFAAFAGDFFFSSLQLAVFALVSAPLTYIDRK